jgi:hypothetical protein
LDAAVARALARWPNVPACFGWLRLDARGQWRLGAAREPVVHRGLIEFIGRNYGADANGAWYFQNGPQRVFVALDYTPLVHRLAAESPLRIETHTGLWTQRITAAWLDESGNLLLAGEHGPGIVIDRDLPRMLERMHEADGSPAQEASIEALLDGSSATGLTLHLDGSRLPLAPIRRAEVAARFGFEPAPAAPGGI